MSSLFRLCIIVASLVPALAHSAALENPGHNQFYSGVGVISGWKCEADGIAVSLDGQPWIPVLYGTQRPDTYEVCGDTNNGFVAIYNWARLGDGEHTAIVYDNGVEFGRSTFEVATLGEEFVVGVEAECMIQDFPSPGETAEFRWNQNTQHLELVGEGGPPPPPASNFWCLFSEGDDNNPIFSRHGHFCDAYDSPLFIFFSEEGEELEVEVEDCAEAIDLRNEGPGGHLPFILEAEYRDRQACIAALRRRCPEGITEGDFSSTSASCHHDNHEG